MWRLFQNKKVYNVSMRGKDLVELFPALMTRNCHIKVLQVFKLLMLSTITSNSSCDEILLNYSTFQTIIESCRLSHNFHTSHDKLEVFRWNLITMNYLILPSPPPLLYTKFALNYSKGSYSVGRYRIDNFKEPSLLWWIKVKFTPP